MGIKEKTNKKINSVETSKCKMYLCLIVLSLVMCLLA